MASKTVIRPIECVRRLLSWAWTLITRELGSCVPKQNSVRHLNIIFGVKSGFERGHFRMHGFISYCQFSKVKNFYVSKLQEAGFIIKLL